MEEPHQVPHAVVVPISARRDLRVPERLDELASARMGGGEAGDGVGRDERRRVVGLELLGAVERPAVAVVALRFEEGVDALAPVYSG